MRGTDLGFVGSLIRRDVRARLRDRWPLILWIAIPLAIGAMITAVGGGGATPVARLLLVDHDQSLISGLVSGAFNQGPLANLIELETTDEADARRRLDADEASAMLVVPEGFGEAVLNEQPSELRLLTNPAQRILPGIIEGVLGVMVDGVFYLHRVFGPQIKTLNELISDGEGTPGDAAVAALSVSINQAVATAGEYLLPPLLEVEFEEPPGAESSQGPGFGVLFFPGIVLMSLLFAAQSLADDFWKERESGTLRRLAVAPPSLVWLLVAKAGSVLLLLAFVCLIVLAIGFGYHGLSLVRLPLSLLWLATGGVMLYAILTSIATLAPSRSSASVLTTALVFPLLMAGGSFFPFEAMPDWLAGIGQWLPNGYLLSGFKDYMLERSGPLDLLEGFVVVIPVTVSCWR